MSSNQVKSSNILLNMAFFLQERNDMLDAEARHLLRSLKYSSANTIKETRFDIECKVVAKGIEKLIEKTEKFSKNIDERIEMIYIFKNSQIESTKGLEEILLLDCMRARSHSLAEKLEYFHQAYENIVSSHKFLHIPTPSVSRRVKASNLMLYLDKKITREYDFLSRELYAFDSGEDNQVFSTWNFSAHDHLKIYDDTNNHYISFNFWLLEKQYFYPIAYHEIGHALYESLYGGEDKNNILLGEESAERISQRLHIARRKQGGGEHRMQHAMVHIIYQDIIADLGAYAVSGEGYIHSLFYTGFMRGIHKNFYKDFGQESKLSEKKFSEEYKECINKHKELTLLTWANTEKDITSFFVRLHILIDLHEDFLKEHQLEISESLQGIRHVLDMVYPRGKLAQEDPVERGDQLSFEIISSVSEKSKKDYLFEKSFMLLAYHLLKKEIYVRESMIKIIKELRTKKAENFQNKIKALHKDKYFDTLVPKSKFEDIHKLILFKNNGESNNPAISTYYDFIWQYRYIKVDNFEYPSHEEQIDFPRLVMPSGRLMRFKNLYELGVTKAIEPELSVDEIIYEMVFFKFANSATILNDFNEQTFERILTGIMPAENRISYALGPYDYVLLSPKSTRRVDKVLEQLDVKYREAEEDFVKKTEAYFTERHALLLLKSYTNSSGNSKYLDFVVAYSSRNEFSGEDDKLEVEIEVLNNQISILSKELSIDAKLFASMGNENFLIYFENLNEQDIFMITQEIIFNENILGNSYSTILINQEKNKRNIKLGKEAIITILCKLKTNHGENKQAEVENEITDAIEEAYYKKPRIPKAYRLYGIFDYKIVLETRNHDVNRVTKLIKRLSDIFLDIQIEYQEKIGEDFTL